MNTILYWSAITTILLLVLAVIISEFYKIRFESSFEAKDERGILILLKQKTLSYHILFLGICSAFIFIICFDLLARDWFVYWIMFTGFLQSIASTIYTIYLRKIE